MKLKTLLDKSYISIATIISISVQKKFGIPGHVVRRHLRRHYHCMTCESQDKFEDGSNFYCCCKFDEMIEKYGKESS